jgi:septal ring factor EnvC (AmiA/AmiB activator)
MLAPLLALPFLAEPAVTLRAQTTPTPAPGSDLSDERAALSRASAQANEARRRSESLEAKATRTTAAADRTRDQAAALAARIQQSEADLRAGQARLSIIAAQQRAQARRLARRQQPITQLTAALQQLARRSPVLALVEPGSVSDAVHRRIVLAQVLPVIMDRTRNLRAELARSEDLRRSAQVANSSLAKTRDNLLAQRATLATLEQRQRLAARQLRDTAGIENERALAMGEQARDMGDLLGRVEAAGSVRDALMSLPGPTLRPATPGAIALPTNAAFTQPDTTRPPAYRLPVIGEVVTGFGELTPDGVRARGLTILTSPAATVVAPAAGRIAFAGPFQGYGRILIIEHGHGWTSLVANLDRLSAQVGDEVRLGDPIGNAGPGQPRLTVELRQGEKPVNIVSLLR